MNAGFCVLSRFTGHLERILRAAPLFCHDQRKSILHAPMGPGQIVVHHQDVHGQVVVVPGGVGVVDRGGGGVMARVLNQRHCPVCVVNIVVAIHVVLVVLVFQHVHSHALRLPPSCGGEGQCVGLVVRSRVQMHMNGVLGPKFHTCRHRIRLCGHHHTHTASVLVAVVGAWGGRSKCRRSKCREEVEKTTT